MSGLDFRGKIITVSVSGAPDTARLGFDEDEVNRVVRALCIAVVSRNGRIGYGGAPFIEKFERFTNYTQAMQLHVSEAYAQHKVDQPYRGFRHYIALPHWADWSGDALFDYAARISTQSDVILVDAAPSQRWRLVANRERAQDAPTVEIQGDDQETATVIEAAAAAEDQKSPVIVSVQAYDGAGYRHPAQSAESGAALLAALGPRAESASGAVDEAAAYTTMRRVMASEERARVLIGGKLKGYKGALPGVIEEAILSLEAGALALPIASLGGAAHDAALALGILPEPLVERRPDEIQSKAEYDAAIAALAAQRPTFERITKAARISRDALIDVAMADTPTRIANTTSKVLEKLT